VDQRPCVRLGQHGLGLIAHDRGRAAVPGDCLREASFGPDQAASNPQRRSLSFGETSTRLEIRPCENDSPLRHCRAVLSCTPQGVREPVGDEIVRKVVALGEFDLASSPSPARVQCQRGKEAVPFRGKDRLRPRIGGRADFGRHIKAPRVGEFIQARAEWASYPGHLRSRCPEHSHIRVVIWSGGNQRRQFGCGVLVPDHLLASEQTGSFPEVGRDVEEVRSRIADEDKGGGCLVAHEAVHCGADGRREAVLDDPESSPEPPQALLLASWPWK